MPPRKESTQDNKKELGEISLSAAVLKEYEGVLNLFTHTENSVNSIFNFFVTLLTTITGAIIVLIQISQPSQSSLVWTIPGLLVLIFTIGIITQEFLIYKEAELAFYTISINAIKNYLFKSYPEIQSQIFFLSGTYAQARVVVNPQRVTTTKLEKTENFFWWAMPVSMPQLFVSLSNSLAITAIFIQLILGLLPGAIPLLRLVVGSAFVLSATYIVQCTYANLKFNSKISRSYTALNGEIHPWFQKLDRK